MKQNQKGFSLIELVVAIAILSIVGLGVVAFLSTSTQSYASVSQNVDVQEEAQTVINQITTMLQNAELGITGTDKTGDGSLLIYNEDYRYVIAKSGDKLYYLKQEKKESGDSYGFDTVDVSAAEASGFSLLAEYVTAFSAVDVTTSGASRSTILLSMDFQKGTDSTSDYTVSQNVVLRNTVVLNPTDYRNIYGTPSSPVQKTTYSNITVTIENPIGSDTEFTYTPSTSGAVYVPERGDASEQTLSYSVNVSYTGPNPDPSYTASLTGAVDSSKTYVDTANRKVHIDAGQTADMELKISLVKSPSVQVNIPIRIVRVTGISIGTGSALTSGFGDLCYVGNTLLLGSDRGLTASVAGTNLDRSDWGNVTWQVDILDSEGRSLAGYPQEVSGSYTIPEGIDGDRIRFIATSTFDSSVSGTSSYYTVLSSHNKISLSLVPESMNRGMSKGFALTDETGKSYDKIDGYDSGNLEFSLILTDQTTGKEVSDTSGIEINKSNYTIRVSSDHAKLDYNKSYSVSMMVKDTNRDIESNRITFTIPAVTVDFETNAFALYTSDNSVTESGWEFEWGGWNWKQIEYYKKTVSYEITGIETSCINEAQVVQSTVSSGSVTGTNSFRDGTGTYMVEKKKNEAMGTLDILCTAQVNGTAIAAETLHIFGSSVPEHSLRLVLDKSEADRGDTVAVRVFRTDSSTGKETELSLTELDALKWTCMLDGSEKSGSWRSGNVITIWSEDSNISYKDSHTVTITVEDDTETATADVSVPKVTVEYSENPVYLCIPENLADGSSDSYQKTVTYSIKGICNAKISGFADTSHRADVDFNFDAGSFTVKCQGNASFTLVEYPVIKVNDNDKDTTQLTDSTFTLYGSYSNTITVNGITYTIEPVENPYYIDWYYTEDDKIAYRVYKGENGTLMCWAYCISDRSSYYYRYDDGNHCWNFIFYWKDNSY